jgi:electron transfer flavoprotein beta subunit
LGYNCVVLIKQVPDTKSITGDVMNDDGTVKRSALPAIFNPEDLNALELALEIKDRFGGHITVIAMGLPAASAILRDSLFRGADEAILVTDRRCAASDTLATSYILSCAVKKLDYDIVLCGRQAIDGDTAQVGPQLAEKLGVTQITYVEELIELDGRTITAQRNIGNGWQQVKAELPVLVTVMGDGEADIKELTEHKCSKLVEKGLLIKQWDLDFLEADLSWCGQSGSPTKVHRIQSVVLAAKESKEVEPNDKGISDMIHELIEEKTIA